MLGHFSFMPTEIAHSVSKFILIREQLLGNGRYLASCWALLAVLGSSTISEELPRHGDVQGGRLPCSRKAPLQLSLLALCNSTNDALHGS